MRLTSPASRRRFEGRYTDEKIHRKFRCLLLDCNIHISQESHAELH